MRRPARTQPCRVGAAGFTLLELLVAIFIFAIMSAMAYGGLNTVLNSRRHIELSLDRTRQFEKTFLRLRDDLQNGSSRTIRDGDGQNQPAFVYDSTNKRPEFTRGGWSNPAGLPRATLERVSYLLNDDDAGNNKLVRRSWRVLDRASQTQPVDTVLLEHVTKLSWRFLDSNNTWRDRWPGPDVPVGTSNCSVPEPVAVEASVSTTDWGDFKLLFRYGPDGINTKAAATPTGGQPGTPQAQPQGLQQGAGC